MPTTADCPKCGHRPVRFGQITMDAVTRTTFFCDNCEHRWSTTSYPRVAPDTPPKKKNRSAE